MQRGTETLRYCTEQQRSDVMARGTAQRSSMMNNQPQALPAGHSYGRRISNSEWYAARCRRRPKPCGSDLCLTLWILLLFMFRPGWQPPDPILCNHINLDIRDTATQGRSRPLNLQAMNLSSSTIQQSLALGLLTVSAAVRSTVVKFGFLFPLEHYSSNYQALSFQSLFSTFSIVSLM